MNINIKLFNKAKKENDIEMIEILSRLMPEARIYINGIRAKISQKKWYEKNKDKISQKSKEKWQCKKKR